MVRGKSKLPKKRLGMKYTSPPAPDRSSSDEGVNPYLPTPAEKKTTKKKTRRDAPSTSKSSSAFKGRNDKSQPNDNMEETNIDSISRDQYRQAVRGLIELEWKCNGCEQIVTNDVPEDTSIVVERSFDIPEAIVEQSIPEETIGDVPTDEPHLRYGIVETGSIRGKHKLVDTDGFSYTVKNTKDDHTLWRCSKRSKTINCPATVVQDGTHYKPGLKNHVHPAEPGSIIAIRIKAEVKAQANKTVFGKSARTIVESVMREESDLAAPEGSRPSQTNLIRAANRLRQGLRPADPVDMDS